MTREEAIQILNNLAWNAGSVDREKIIAACGMAIEALSEPSTIEVPIKYPSDRSREIIVLFDTEDGVGDKCDLCRHAFVGEIIRCENCTHWNSETKGCKRNPSVEAWEETDYCSYGERRKP